MSIRVTDSQMAHILVQDNHRSLARMLRLQRMASSLRRVNTYADDPVAVGAINRYRNLLDSNSQYLRNAERARAFVDATDQALTSIQDVLIEARVIAIRESSAQASDETQDQSAVEVSGLLDRLLNILNVSVEGDYIFSGHHTSVPPFVRTGDVVHYQGDTGLIDVQIGPQATLTANTPGDVFVGANSAVLAGSVDMAPTLQLTDNLSDLNLGAGWETGSFNVTDGNGNQYTIDLTAAVTVGDVVNEINLATGGAVTADISIDGKGLRLNGTGPLTITEVNGGHTAQSLGLSGSSAGDQLEGHDIRIAPTPSTLLSDIPALNGALPLGMVNVSVGNNDYTINFSAVTTIAQMQFAFSFITGLQMRIDGGVLSIVSGSTEPFEITNGDDTATASKLGIEGTGSSARLFGLFTDLKAALESHDPDAIRSNLAELAVVSKIVMAETVKVGGKENNLDWMSSLLRQRDERLQSGLSREWDADIAQVATDLSQAQAAYEASLLVTSRLFEVNLMQFLR